MPSSPASADGSPTWTPSSWWSRQARQVADRVLIHYRLDLAQRGTRWACTQTPVCKIVDGRLATIDLLCSGFREIQE